MDGLSIESSVNYFFSTFLAIILKNSMKYKNGQSNVAIYGGISNLYIVQIHI